MLTTLLVVHAGIAGAAVLLLAWLGRRLAQLLAQPPVVGEIAAGLAVAPVVVVLAGRPALNMLLPAEVMELLWLVGEVGLALFLVGVAHHIRPGSYGLGGRTVTAVTVGASVPALVAGGGLAVWLLAHGGTDLRGEAPASAFVLLIALAFAVTAVPVLARILQHGGRDRTPEGMLAMTAAIAIDAAMWLLLAVALTLAAGRSAPAAVAAGTLAGGAVAAWTVRIALARPAAQLAAHRHRRLVAAAVAAAGLGAAAVTHRAGLTVLVGAVLVGLAIPPAADARRDGFAHAVGSVSRYGTALLPVFFLTISINLLAEPLADTTWALLPTVLALAVASKVIGTYLGARVAGLPGAAGIRLGILMNTRGLTEIAVLHAGLVVGIITPAIFVILVTTALVTTVMTGPLLAVADRWTLHVPRR
jgi:Kef-type K+ transport system membrane component KefB